MTSTNFKSQVDVTFIGTATAIIRIDDVTFLTDPAFDPAGTEYPVPPINGQSMSLVSELEPAIKINDLPHIDGVLLSHEDHDDNLDHIGRRFLQFHHPNNKKGISPSVFTTPDGDRKLKETVGERVKGLQDWETITAEVGNKTFKITATPCKHYPDNECIGFILETDSFGVCEKTGLPNAIWFGGDTVNYPEIHKVKERWNIVIGLFNLGKAIVPIPSGELQQITMGAEDCVDLCRVVPVQNIVPMHFTGWGHFTEFNDETYQVLEGAERLGKVVWLERGRAVRVVG